MHPAGQWFESDPLWFKTAIFYEIHLRGFYDGTGDGSGEGYIGSSQMTSIPSHCR